MSSPEAHRWSLRRRLGIGVTAVIVAVLAMLFFALDDQIDARVHAHLDAMLTTQALTVSNALRLNEREAIERVMPEFDLPGHMDFFALYNRDGQLVMASSNSGDGPLQQPPADAVVPHYFDLVSPDRHRARGLAVRTEFRGQMHVLIVATERASWDAAEQQNHYLLLIGLAIAVLTIVPLVLLVVRAAFAPLMRQGARISKIDVDDPPQSVGQDLPRELAPFAAAFDMGLQRLYAAIDRERRFSRDVAHELRTPLAEIRATAEVALRTATDAETRQTLHTTLDAAERMRRSVDTLLALARYESGQEAPALDPLDLRDLLAKLVASLQRATSDRQIALHLATGPAAWVHSDIGILERIVTNLLQNAVDYAPSDTRIDCSIDAVNGTYTLHIINDAPGLMAEDLAHFGTRFWRKQLDGATSHHAGLGLALAAGLAQTVGLALQFDLPDQRLHARLGPIPAL